MFEVGEIAYDLSSGARIQVLEKNDVWGYTSYKVYDSSKGIVYQVPEEQLSEIEIDMHYDVNYLRYISLLSKIKNETADGVISSLSSTVIPLPHQLHVLNRALDNNKIRFILADEVGLGKTIEAGMIIKEMKARGLIKRILIVCPTGLVTQWSAEMKDKFHERFNIVLPSDYDVIRRITDSNDVYGKFEQVISPMDSIKPIEARSGWTDERIDKYNEERIYSIINSGWDLIIIDEAHRVAGSSGEVARYKLGYLLSQASPYLLLLTATPHNGKTEPFLRLVRLLDKEAFPNAKSVVKEQVAPYIIRTEKREAIDNNGNLLFKNRITHLVSLNWDERHTKQKDLYERVTNYVRETYNIALRNRKKNMMLIFLLIIMQRMVTSSTEAIRSSLLKRLSILINQQTKLNNITEEELVDLDLEDGSEDAIHAVSLDMKNEINELEEIVEIAKQAEYQNPDAKIEELVNLLDRLLSKNLNQKIIVFTEFVATQEFLYEMLIKKSYSVSILNGKMSIEERNETLREFREKCNILISTDAGGEGLNLQFSNVVINFDLPWNPMKIEQRCGRVDRIGQTKDVEIYNFIIKDTVENRVRQVLEEKLSVILNEIGIDKYSDVLDSEVAEINYTDVYMRTIANPDNISKNVYPVVHDLKEQVENAKKYKSLIKEDKDLTQLIGAESKFDVESALRMTLNYFDAWKGNNPRVVDEALSITDEVFAEHIRKTIRQDRISNIMSISIDDFPNEAGYFMLWELSISEASNARKIIPIFVNNDLVLRPMAGHRIMDAFLNPQNNLTIKETKNISDALFDKLQKISTDYAYDAFVAIKEKIVKKSEDDYKKYKYALSLRLEAAQHIGIENIRIARIKKIQIEEQNLENRHREVQQFCPEFNLMLLSILEA